MKFWVRKPISRPPDKTSIRGKVRLGIFLGFSLLVGVPAFIDLSIEWEYENRTLHASNYRSLRPATVAIVPGASVYKGVPSPVLQDRLDCALELYRHGKVRKILLSGDNGQSNYNEVKPMLLYVLERNVKEKDVFVDHAGFRTLDTLVRAREIFQVKDAIFVSQKFHQPRAAFIARKIDLEFQSYESDRRLYVSGPASRFREFFARTLAWIDMNLTNTAPKYLGEPFPIEASGVKTWKGSVN